MLGSFFSVKKQKLLYKCLVISLLVTGCSSSRNIIKQQVVANSDRTLKTPEWVLNSQVLSEQNGDLVFVYRMYLDGTTRPDACLSMAKTQATGEMMKYIKNAITSSGQVEDLNASSDPSFSSLTAFLSQGNLSGAKVTNLYWEQTIESDSTGMRPVKRLMCAAQVAIDKVTIDKQMRDAINGAPGGNAEIRKKLLDAQKNFIDNVGENPGGVTPASDSQ